MDIKSCRSIVIAFVFCVVFSAIAFGQTTTFTYQGKLTDNGTPASGPYDLTFRLYDLASGGTQIGPDELRSNVSVVAGIFSVSLDFGASPFTSTTGSYLEISVRPGGTSTAFVPLSPRQAITSSPYALQTLRAASAAIADNSSQLGGVDASQYVQDSDSRLTDARVPLAGSANYIQSNPATQQPGTNLNIGGNATVGGTLSGNVVNATTQYNIGGNRVLSVAGTENFFAGLGAGQSNSGSGFNNSFAGNLAGTANTTGGRNAFFGSSAGAANISGFDNSFFGNQAGINSIGSGNSFFGATAGPSNTSGGDNSFFGNIAGQLNTSGTNNAFFGALAGRSNTTGSSNTILGSNANVGSGSLSNATAIGAGSVVSTSDTVVLGRNSDTVRVPGNLNVVGSFTGNFTVPAGNITGVLAAANGGTGPAGASGNFLRSDGTNWTSSVLQASDIPAGNTHYIQNISGIGQQTGSFNITGGGTANILNAETQYNIRGFRVLSVSGLTIFGATNTFAGAAAGTNNATGESNSYFGQQTGSANTVSHGNSFFGRGAGSQNLGGSNSFFGLNAGLTNTTGSSNTLFGANANVGAANLLNATAIGANAVVSQSNSLVLGSNANVGIGISSPTEKLNVVGNGLFTGNLTGNIVNATTQFDIGGGRVLSTPGSLNTFVGHASGGATTGQSNAFFGQNAGINNQTGSQNTFIGRSAGTNNTGGSDNTMVGHNANGGGGLSNTTAIGANALVTRPNSMVLGNNVNVGIGVSAPNAKLQIAGGSVYIQQPNSLIITSPNGACWFITVNDAGGLSTIPVGCP